MESLREGIIKAAMHGLLPGRDCHLLAFRTRKGGQRLATYVPNYFGLILALERTGKVAKAFAHPVYQGDDFEVDYLADVYRHVPAVTRGKKPGSLRFFYGCIRMKDGTTHIEIMDEAQIDAVKRRSPAHEHGPWIDDYLMMARKTVLKRVMKYVRLTPEVRAMLNDDTTREHDDIPATRHQQNIIDVFGEGADPTAPQPTLKQGSTYIVNADTGELEEDDGQETLWEREAREAAQQGTEA
jgi:recombination protein RecT